MKLIDTEIHISVDIDKESASIKVAAKFEDIAHNLPVVIELEEWISLESGKLRVVLDEVARIATEHPFFKLKLCESPIELRFFVYAMNRIPNLRPQVIVGPYRVDLAIPEKKVAIELDGHEFHKTRQQRTQDAKRERYLQKQGWQIIRFTGTEIHKDVFECIDEAIQIIAKKPIL